MHICFIIESYLSETALSSNNIHSEAVKLHENGIHVSVVTNGEKNIYVDGIRVLGLKCWKSKLYYFIFIVKAIHSIAKLNKEEKIDIVHAQWAGVTGFTAVLISKLFKIPAIATCRGFDINYSEKQMEYGAYRSIFARMFVKYTLNYAKKIVCISGKLKESILQLWKIQRKDIAVIYPAVNPIFLRSKNENSKNTNNTVILTAGGLRKIKRIEDVLGALKLLKKKKIKFEYWIAGPETDNKKGLLALVNENELVNEVKFLGYNNIENMVEIYDKSDIYINVSVLEGFGRTYLEAMARKKPIILTSVTGCSEVIRNMETGIIVESYNTEQIAQSLELLITNKKFAEKIGQKGYEYLIENHSMDKFAAKQINIYKDLLLNNSKHA
ncbi:MAG: hypothetical protein A2252_07440 [Elusimicrobia bacterium RIFOXYA2_FULL_39_19]|nr:MAG: hypothetical protein A2252_07440 [Elusimicrobia bacterium RIFOXYA2_FULL_39_19]